MILCYHAVNPEWDDWLSVPPERFAEHVAWLAGQNALPLDELLEGRARRATLPRRPIAVTFDDGFADLYDHALPVVRRSGLPITIYLVVGTLVDGQPVNWVDTPPTTTLTTLTLDQILEMQEAGVRFGSHTWSHPDLRTLSDRELDVELGRSREALADLLGAPVTTVAYPRGLHSAAVRRAAARAGYDFALSLPVGGPEPLGRYAVPRVGIGGGDGVRSLRVKAHPLALKVRLSRLQRVGTAGARAARALTPG